MRPLCRNSVKTLKNRDVVLNAAFPVSNNCLLYTVKSQKSSNQNCHKTSFYIHSSFVSLMKSWLYWLKHGQQQENSTDSAYFIAGVTVRWEYYKTPDDVPHQFHTVTVQQTTTPLSHIFTTVELFKQQLIGPTCCLQTWNMCVMHVCTWAELECRQKLWPFLLLPVQREHCAATVQLTYSTYQ